MRKLIRLGILIVVLLLGAAVALFFYIDAIAKSAIERGGTYALGVETTLDTAKVGIFSGEFTMSGLNVANPEGFDSPHFLDLQHGGVAVGLTSLMSETVELPFLRLVDMDINLQKAGDASNYQVILDHLKRIESDDAPSDEDGKRFIVREITIRNVNVHVDLIPAGGKLTKMTFPIEEIILTDVGSDSNKGLLLADLVGVLVKAVLAAIVDKTGEILPGDMLTDLRGNLAQLESLRDLGIGLEAKVADNLQNLVDDLSSTIEETLDEGLKGVGQGLGGLLGGGDDED